MQPQNNDQPALFQDIFRWSITLNESKQEEEVVGAGCNMFLSEGKQ